MKLSTGNHRPPAPEAEPEAACVMELVSYLAGEPWSDHPACACRSLTEAAICANDRGPQWVRDRLQTLAPRIVGTRAAPHVEIRREFILVDCAVREIAPLALDAAGLTEEAARLRALSPIVDRASASIAYDAVSNARRVATDAARIARAAEADAVYLGDVAACASNATDAAAHAAYIADYAGIADDLEPCGSYCARTADFTGRALALASDPESNTEPSAWETFLAAFERAIEVTS